MQRYSAPVFDMKAPYSSTVAVLFLPAAALLAWHYIKEGTQEECVFRVLWFDATRRGEAWRDTKNRTVIEESSRRFSISAQSQSESTSDESATDSRAS